MPSKKPVLQETTGPSTETTLLLPEPLLGSSAPSQWLTESPSQPSPKPTNPPTLRPSAGPKSLAPSPKPTESPRPLIQLESTKPSEIPSLRPSTAPNSDCWKVFVATSAGLVQLNTQDLTLQTNLSKTSLNVPASIGFRGDELWGGSSFELERFDTSTGTVTANRTLDFGAALFVLTGLGTDPVTAELVVDGFERIDDPFIDDDGLDDLVVDDDGVDLTGLIFNTTSIFQIDIATGSGTKIGAVGNYAVSGDISSYKGKLYASVFLATDASLTNSLVQINPGGNEGTLIGTLPSNSMWGLAEVGVSGGTTELWGFDGEGDVYNININGDTMISDLVGNIGVEVSDAASSPC